MARIKATTDGKKGGTLGGNKPHSKGGIKAVVVDAGNKPVELESSEAIIKKSALKDKTVKTITGTNAEILNEINTEAGGNPIYAPSELKEGSDEEFMYGGSISYFGKYFSDKNYRWKYSFEEIPRKAYSTSGIKLGDLIEHEELFRLYPKMKNVKVSIRNDEGSGNLASAETTHNLSDYSLSKIKLPINTINGKEEFKLGEKHSEYSKEATLLHEIQHLCQQANSRSIGRGNKEVLRQSLEKRANLDTRWAEYLGQKDYKAQISEQEAMIAVKKWLEEIGYEYTDEFNFINPIHLEDRDYKKSMAKGGSITPSAINKMTKAEQKAFYKTKEGKALDKETYTKWKSLVNMSKGELESFYNSKEGKEAGLSAKEAKAEGIDSGRESARWIMKMKDIPYTEWTSNMWVWAKKQISFVSRMKGMRGDLYDDKGNKTRKHLALLIWGHNPKKDNFEDGGLVDNTNNSINENEKKILPKKLYPRQKQYIYKSKNGGFDRFANEKISTKDMEDEDKTIDVEKMMFGGSVGYFDEETFSSDGDYTWNYTAETLPEKASTIKGIKLGELIDHKTLFFLFPELRKVKVIFEENKGDSDADSECIFRGNIATSIIKLKLKINPNGKRQRTYAFEGSRPECSAYSTLLHETQHILQFANREEVGFSYSGENESKDGRSDGTKANETEGVKDNYDAYKEQEAEQEAMLTVLRWLNSIGLPYVNINSFNMDLIPKEDFEENAVLLSTWILSEKADRFKKEQEDSQNSIYAMGGVIDEDELNKKDKEQMEAQFGKIFR